MYVATMRSARRLLLLIGACACIAAMAACGGGSSENTVASTAVDDSAASAEAEAADDHDDEDHGDDGHDDEDHDDHDDEDHDDHGDEDHDDEGASGGLDAHVHGSAELFVAWSGGDVVIDLISPANNIFGFEYEPSSDEDIAIVTDRTAALTTPSLLVFNDEAACSLTGAVDTDFEVDGSHAEVTTSWLFSCDEPGELRELDMTALFAEFPRLEDVDAQWASDDNQSAAELSPSNTILRFE